MQKRMDFSKPGSTAGDLSIILAARQCFDLPGAIKTSSVNMYADDTTLYHGGTNVRDTLDILQEDAESAMRWFNCNRLTVNLMKTNLMVMGRRRREIELNGATLTLNGMELQPKASVKYLGVEIDKSLHWKNM